MKTLVLTLGLILLSPNLQAYSEKVAIDLTVKTSSEEVLKNKLVIADGETKEKKFRRGDIDTIIEVTPSIEINNGKKSVLVEVMLQNLRDGDLINEKSFNLLTLPGQQASLTTVVDELQEKNDISVTTKIIR